MVKNMKFFEGETNGTTPKASKKQRRSRKPKFVLENPKKRCDNKKKDEKKKKEITNTKLLEKLPLMFAQIRASNQRLKQQMSEIDAHVLDQLKAWDDEENQGF